MPLPQLWRGPQVVRLAAPASALAVVSGYPQGGPGPRWDVDLCTSSGVAGRAWADISSGKDVGEHTRDARSGAALKRHAHGRRFVPESSIWHRVVQRVRTDTYVNIRFVVIPSWRAALCVRTWPANGFEHGSCSCDATNARTVVSQASRASRSRTDVWTGLASFASRPASQSLLKRVSDMPVAARRLAQPSCRRPRSCMCTGDMAHRAISGRICRGNRLANVCALAKRQPPR